MKAKFTKGPVEIDPRAQFNVRQAGTDRSIASAGGYTTNVAGSKHITENVANANLIAAAFNAATDMEELGCDGQASIETLKEMYEKATDVLTFTTETPGATLKDGVFDGVFMVRGDWLTALCSVLAKARGET